MKSNILPYVKSILTSEKWSKRTQDFSSTKNNESKRKINLNYNVTMICKHEGV